MALLPNTAAERRLLSSRAALCFPPAVLLTNGIGQKKDEILSSLAAVPRVVIMEAADLADSVSQ